MPRYEYQCESCGIRFDKIQHFKDEPLKLCPECGGAVHRLIQPVGIIFRGSGFYVTDHRSSASIPAPSHKTGVSEKAEASGEVGDKKASSVSKATKKETAD